jgi:Family of unknown function (DUF6544)
MRWRLLRLIPVMTAAGPDTTRSAPGRLAGEIALIPTAFRQATWAPGERAGTVTATWHFGDDTETAELRVGEDGQLLEVVVDRWGQSGRRPLPPLSLRGSGRGRSDLQRDHHPVAIPRRMVVGHRPAG